MKKGIVFLLLIFSFTFASVQAKFNYTTKTLADIPHVVINVTDKVYANVSDWSSLSPQEVIGNVSYPEDLWDYMTSHISYHSDDPIHSFPDTHYLGEADCGDMSLVSGSVMNNTDYGSCILQLCSYEEGQDHWMWFYHENDTYGAFSEDSGWRRGNSIHDILREMQQETNYRYEKYGFFCWGENQTLLETFSTQNLTNVTDYVDFPDCQYDIWYQFYEFSSKTSDDIPNVIVNESEKIPLNVSNWSALTPTEVINVIHYPSDVIEYIDSGKYVYEPTREMYSFPEGHYSSGIDCGDTQLIPVATLNDTNYSQCAIFLTAWVNYPDFNMGHNLYVYKENGKYGAFSEDFAVGYRNYSSMEFMRETFDSIDDIMWHMQQYRDYRYKCYSIFCFDEHPNFVNYIMTVNDSNVGRMFTMPECVYDISYQRPITRQLTDVGAGVGGLFTGMAIPLVVFMILLSLGLMVGAIFGNLFEHLGWE